jgi:nicotinamidase-related amidase
MDNSCIITEFTQGMILPKKENASGFANSNLASLNLNEEISPVKNIEQMKKPTQPAKLILCNLQTSATMKCTALDVYNALTRPEVKLK